jgi:hypothetical protein
VSNTLAGMESLFLKKISCQFGQGGKMLGKG